MRLFKATYKDAHGQTREAEKWTVEFRDHMQVIRRVTLMNDRKASEECGRKIERLVAARMAGLSPDADLTRWLVTLMPRIKERLAETGLIEGQRMAATKQISEHLDEWKTALHADELTPARVQILHSRVSHTLSACGFKYLSEIDTSTVKSHLAERRKEPKQSDSSELKVRPALKAGISAQTYNDTVQALKQFGAWLVKSGRAQANSFAHMDRLNVKTDRRHDRRALTALEISKLIAAAESGPHRHGMTGPARAMLYRMALNTGLRAGELRHLTRSSLDLEKQSVTLDAKHTKNRTACILPLRSDLSLALADFCRDMLPQATLFKMPPKWDVIEMLKADLLAADVLYQDAAGRFADFHALRHTFITNLARSGVHPKVAQDLARHSDINLTMSRYSHTVLEQRAEAVAMLPEIVPATAQSIAEGTTGQVHLASCLAFSGEKQCAQTNVDERGNADTVLASEMCNRPAKGGLAKFTSEKPAVVSFNATLAQLVEQCFRKA